MRKVRVVQVGTTHPHASGIFNSIKALPDVFEIVGVCEPSEAERKNLDTDLYKDTPRLSIEDVLNLKNIDGVIVETTEKDSTRYSKMMADAGFNLHLDKPGGDDFYEYEELVNTAKQKGLTFHTGYMYRFNPAVKKTIELVKNGELGDIYAVDAQMCICLEEKAVKGLKKFNGGMMEFLGCHMLDLVLSVLGMPDKVLPMCYATHKYDTDALDYGMAALIYKNASAVVRSSAVDVNGFIRRQFVVCGTKGSVEIKPMEMFGPRSMTSDMNVTFDSEKNNPCFDFSEKLELEPYQRYDDMMIDFAEIISGMHENSYSYEHEINLKKLVGLAGRTGEN